jgi:hypothetical protein
MCSLCQKVSIICQCFLVQACCCSLHIYCCLWGSLKWGNYWHSWRAVSFTRTLVHGVCEWVSEWVFCGVFHSYILICTVRVRMKVTKMWKVYHVRMKVSLPALLSAFRVVLIYAILCCIWSIALYGTETWTLWKVDWKFLGKFWNVVLEKDGEYHLKNEQVLQESRRRATSSIE